MAETVAAVPVPKASASFPRSERLGHLGDAHRALLHLHLPLAEQRQDRVAGHAGEQRVFEGGVTTVSPMRKKTFIVPASST